MPVRQMPSKPFGFWWKVWMLVGAAMVVSNGCVPPSKPLAPPPAVEVVDSASKPLELQDVITLIPVNGDRLLTTIARTYCINFFVDYEAEWELRRGGVKEEIIEVLKSVCVNLNTNREELAARFALEDSIGAGAAAGQYFAAATAYMRAQRFGAAEGEIRQAIRLVPNNSNYYFLLGESFFHQRKCDIAAAAFETVTRLDPSKGYFAFAKTGECFHLASEWDKARDAYMRALDYEAPPSGRGWLFVRIAELPTPSQLP